MKSYIYTSWCLQTYYLSTSTNMTTNEVLHLHLLISTNIMSVNPNEYDDKWSLTFTLLDTYKHIVCQSERIWRQMKSYIYSSWYLQTYCLSILTNMTTNEVLHLHILIPTNILSVNLNEYDEKMKSYIYSSWYLQTYCLSILTNKTANEVLHLHFLISTNILSVNLNE